MSSIRRQISSRQNGALSRGPATEEGKRRSSLNAHTVNALEPQENFDVILEDHIQGIGPQDGVHLGLIEDMANSQWRMRRLRENKKETNKPN